MAVLLIGYDVEATGRPEVTRGFLRAAAALHRDLRAPCTLFLVGRTAEENADALQELRDDPLFDLQQHTYSHQLLKTVCLQEPDGTFRLFRGIGLEEIREEVRRANDALRRIVGRPATGICGPYNYYRGLMDRPDILEVLWAEGIRFTRTYGRNAQDYQPTPFEVQPFRYEPQGFPEMLEIPIQGFQDCYLRERLGWENVDAYTRWILSDLELVARRGWTWSYCQHDWSNRCDPEMSILRRLLERARELGVEVMSHEACYRRRMEEERGLAGGPRSERTP